MRKNKRHFGRALIIILLCFLFGICGCSFRENVASISPIASESVSETDSSATSVVSIAEPTPTPTPTATPTPKPTPTPTPTPEPVVQPEKLAQQLESAGFTWEDIENAFQLVLVESFDSSATVYYYEKDSRGCWNAVMEASQGYVGFNGVGEAHEGSRFTPYGLYTLDFAFGNADDPGAKMEYRAVTESIYWVDDPDSRYYNQWVDSETVEVWDWDSAEHLSPSPVMTMLL